MDRKTLYLVIAAIAAMLVITVVIMQYMYGGCNYDDPNKTYLNRENGCVINFLCINGEQAFSDQCGCGCKVLGG